jgi:hypothetical protein
VGKEKLPQLFWAFSWCLQAVDDNRQQQSAMALSQLGQQLRITGLGGVVRGGGSKVFDS